MDLYIPQQNTSKIKPFDEVTVRIRLLHILMLNTNVHASTCHKQLKLVFCLIEIKIA